MKQRIYLFLMLVITALTASSRDFEYEGIIYTVLDEEAKTVETKRGSGKLPLKGQDIEFTVFEEETSNNTPGNDVSGSLILPKYPKDGDVEYTLVNIGNFGFVDCNNLTSIQLPDTLNYIGLGAFLDCISLTSIKLPQSLSYIESGAFINCVNLPSIQFPETITAIGRSAFYGCRSLNSIQLPESLTSIYSEAFENCTGIKTIIYDAKDCQFGIDVWKGVNATKLVMGENIKRMRTVSSGTREVGIYPFTQLPRLEDIEYNTTSVIDYDNTNGKLFPTSIKHVYFGNKVSTIQAFLFDSYPNLHTVKFPESLVSIGRGSFRGCVSLSNLDFPKSLTSIGGFAFSGCTSLTSFQLPESLTLIDDWTFENCTALTSVQLPASLTSIRRQAFSGCTNLTSIQFPESLSLIGYQAFYGCNNIISLTFPLSVESIGQEAFNYYPDNNSSKLESIVFKGVPETIEKDAFPTVENISIVNPNTWSKVNQGKYDNDSFSNWISYDSPTGSILVGDVKVENMVLNPEDGNIGSYAFCNAPISKLRITSDRTIGKGAFYGSTIDALCLDARVIQDRAFANCENLKVVYSLTSRPPTAPDNTFSDYENVVLYVPVGSKERYEDMSTCWCHFRNIVESDFADIDDLFKANYNVGDLSSIVSEPVAENEIDYSLPYNIINLNGSFIGHNKDSLEKGIYIIRQGNAIKKVAVK